MSYWQQIKEYINFKEIGSIITRKELTKRFLNLIDTGTYKYYEGLGETTLDTFRNYFMKAEFLKRISPGKYKLVKKIPSDLTIKECIALGDKDNLKYLELRYKRKLRSVKTNHYRSA